MTAKQYFTFTASNGDAAFEMVVTIQADNIAVAAKYAFDVYGDSIDSVAKATPAERDAEIARAEAQMRAAFS